MDKKEIMSKYVTFCGKLYGKISTFFNGRHEQTPETIQRNKVRGTWIVSIFIGLSIVGAFMDEEEEVPAETSKETLSAEDRTQTEAPRKSESKPVTSSWNYTPSSSVYVCAKCATVVTGSSQPRSTKCPNSSGMHQWDRIGSKGDTPYQCGKCGASINSQPTPSPGRCPRGLGHKWDRL